MAGNNTADESIELIRVDTVASDSIHSNSPKSSATFSLKKLKPNNRIGSPLTNSSPPSRVSTPSIKDPFIVRKSVSQLSNASAKQDDTKKTPDFGSSKTLDLLDISKEEAKSNVSNKSSLRTFRDKLKDRFETVKLQAETSILKATNQDQPKRKPSKLAKAYEELAEDEQQIQIQLENHSARPNASDLDEFSFFCYENGSPPPIQKNIVSPHDSIETVEDPSLSPKDTLSIEYFLHNALAEDLVLKYVKPEVAENYSLAEGIWYPRKKPIFQKPLEVNGHPRYIEDEGLYVGKRPRIPRKELALLEQRLLADDNHNWFGCDGLLNFQPDPRTKETYRPTVSAGAELIVETVYVPPLPFECTSRTLNVKKSPVLQIIISDIKFEHHPLFSFEHVLMHRLLRFFGLYERETIMNNQGRTSQKLTVLRQAKKTLVDAINNSSEDTTTQLTRLKGYKEEIKHLRSKLYKQAAAHKRVCNEMTFTWRAIKTLRKNQTYSNTAIRLLAKKEEHNEEAEEKRLTKMMDMECAEVIEEMEDQYQTSLKEYKAKLKAWRAYARRTDGDKILVDEAGDNISISLEKPQKPQRNIDYELVREEMAKTYETSFRIPGEPVLHFQLSYENEVTKNVTQPKEKMRRSAVQKTKIYYKLYFNHREVCTSRLYSLTDNFTCEVNESMPCEIVHAPEELNVEIYECEHALTGKLLANIKLDIPEPNPVQEDAYITNYDFSREEVINTKHTGVGCGMAMNSLLEMFNPAAVDEQVLQLSGVVEASVSWVEIDEESAAEIKRAVKGHLFDDRGMSSVRSWTEGAKLDPQNPKNQEIFDYLMQASHEQTEENKYFRLNPYMKPLEFCDHKELDGDLRLKMLKLRDADEPEFRGVVIPNRSRELPVDVLNSYMRRINEEDIVEGHQYRSVFDSHRAWGHKQLSLVKNRIMNINRGNENALQIKNVMTEEFMPDLKTLSMALVKWLKPVRRLRPLRNDQKNMTSNAVNLKMNLVINVMGAIQVPVRTDYGSSTVKNVPSSINMVPVKPFVVLTFQGKTLRTTTGEGSSPIWNQELIVPISNTMNGGIQNISDKLTINMFDEILFDVLDDDRTKDVNIHQQIKHNWLGGVEIAFPTLYQNTRIEGTFKLSTPTTILGYDQKESSNGSPNFTKDYLSKRDSTYLSLLITLQPIPIKPDDAKLSLESMEPISIQQHIDTWQKHCISLFPNRKFPTLVACTNGKTCSLTRFLSPVNWPNVQSLPNLTAEYIFRFVTLIPFDDGGSSVQTPHVWLTTEETLKFLTGSVTDHAVMLACYFLAMDMKCWLLLGNGIPLGDTAYVLVKEKPSYNQVDPYYLYDIVSGKKYSISESFCPLQKVYCLANNENMWANIQKEGPVYKMRYDVARAGDWLPLFDRQVPGPVETVQNDSITYLMTPETTTFELQIEKRLRKRIMKWRKHSRTVWNHHCSSCLKKALKSLEGSFFNEESPTGSADIVDVQNLFMSYKVFGFPINVKYTSLASLIDTVRSTNIHLNDTSQEEFALGVHVVPYPNLVLSVWIYLAVLVRRR